MNNKINIAIDGYSSCGKGTLAKALAKELNYLFIDSGAMYRAVTLAMFREGIVTAEILKIETLLPTLEIRFKHIPERQYYHTILNGEDVEVEIRSMQVSNLVSPVSAIPEVRAFLVDQQQKIGTQKGVVMDGRDIGTVVFPLAELKIFMTARPEIRAQRRLMEMQEKGIPGISFDQILNNLNERDKQDSERINSPLKIAEDAVVIDNSDLGKEQQFRLALELANKKINT